MTALYVASYVDERERVECVHVHAESVPEALRMARAEIRLRAAEARLSYAAKGIRLRIHRAQYRLILMSDVAGNVVFRETATN